MILHQQELPRLLALPLGGALLNVEVSADLYATNGFRFVATPAHPDREELERESQRWRNIYKLAPERAMNDCIRVGYESRLDLDQVGVYLSRLQNPRDRIICELFWPHLPPDLFSCMRKERQVFSDELARLLSAAASSGTDEARILASHALAIAHHNQAISQELTYAAGEGPPSDEHWQRALEAWARVLASDVFWDYLRRRALSFDDPRCRPEDVDQLRAGLPGVLLGFNALFAQAYAKAGYAGDTARHVALIHGASLEAESRTVVLENLVKSTAHVRLDPLRQRLRKGLEERTGKQGYKEFDAVCKPVLDEAEATRTYLLDSCRFPGELVDSSEFDQLCDTILKALNTDIDYKRDDRVRSILYSSLVAKRLARLPLSSSQARKVEQALRRDGKILYDEFSNGDPLDHTGCWFLDGEEADPGASYIAPVYKITDVEGATIRWASTSILVPRSRLAKAFHDGKVKLDELAATPAEPEEVPPASAGGVLGESLGERIWAFKQRIRSEVQDFESRVAPEEKKLRHTVKKAEEKLSREVAEEHGRRDEACRKIKQRLEGQIAVAEKKLAAVQARWRGLRGAVGFEVPVAAASYPLLVAAVWLGPSGLSAEALGWCLLGSLLLAAGVGRTIRGFKIGQARRPVTRLLDQQVAEIGAVGSQTEKRTGELKSTTRKTLAPTQARLKEIAQERKHRLARHQPKDQRAKSEFPPVKNAMQQGYKAGNKPSQSEIDRLAREEAAKFKRRLDSFMWTLSYDEKQTLARLAQVMSEDKFVEFLRRVMDAPAAQRKALLRLGLF